MNTLNTITSMMSDSRLSNSFKSYIGFDEESLNASSEDVLIESLHPRLLPDETVIAEAQKVLMYVPVSERKKGKTGSLYVTNFKLSFITPNETLETNGFLEHLYLGENDVCLSNVESLYTFGDKKRRLARGKSVVDGVRGLYVLCKNMRSLKFSFKFSPVGHGKTLTTALLHHAFPTRHQLLFAYDFMVANNMSGTGGTVMFREAGDWSQELARTSATGWHLLNNNRDFQLAPSLGRWVVVAGSVSEWQVGEVSRHFRCGRLPQWCWSGPGGASLVRCGDALPGPADRLQENAMLESVRKSHPKRAQPVVIDLTGDLPSPRDVNSSYLRLRKLAAPDDIKMFLSQDNNFYSLLDSSKWLTYVSACLRKSSDVAKILYRETTVVLQEGDGRDMCCVVASLAQLLMDPYFRTVLGFQSLVQKEWIAAGHPFSTRLGHVENNDNNQSPLLLLFLDCVWQLLQQFQTEFEFNETYLTALWDCAFVSTYETFLFDCERDRFHASTVPAGGALILRSVWEDQVGFRDSRLLLNPFYSDASGPARPLPVRTALPCLDLWRLCYFRHTELLEIRGGGDIQVEMEGRLMVGAVAEGGPAAEIALAEGLETLPSIGSFFPFSCSSSASAALSSSFLVSSLSLNQSFHAATDHLLSSPD